MTTTHIPNKTIHFFGEMDLNLSLTKDQIYDEAMRIAEACGYMVEWYKNSIGLLGQDYESAVIMYDKDGHITTVRRSLDNRKTWDTLDFGSGVFQPDQDTLKRWNMRIPYGTPDKLPMSQGSVMNEIIKTYKLHPVRWGWYQDLIGLETEKQFLIWRDTGVGAEFQGIINKDGTTPS